MVVLDSSFLVAFFNAADGLHARAAAAMERLAAGEWGETLLPEYVVLEVLTMIAARLDHATADAAIVAIARRHGARILTFDPDFGQVEGVDLLP